MKKVFTLAALLATMGASSFATAFADGPINPGTQPAAAAQPADGPINPGTQPA